jgi:outer membrane protein assembly factor BamA
VDDSLAVLYPTYLGNGNDALRYLKLSYQFNLDKRDNRAYPLDGYLFQLELSQRGLGIVDSDGLGVFESAVAIKSYRPLSERWFIGAGLRLKTIPTKRLPYYIQEGLGYSSYVRGYEYYVVDGQQFALWRSNLKFALVPRKEFELGFGPKHFTKVHFASYLNVFMDAGRVWDNLYAAENDLSNEWLIGLGAGLDLVSYYDSVIRIEYSVNGQGRTGFYLHFVQPI